MGGRGSSGGGGGGGKDWGLRSKSQMAAGLDRYTRLKAGEMLHMLNPMNGVKFDVHLRESKFGGLSGYVVSQNGKAAKGYKGGMIQAKEDAVHWLGGLKETK